jgi:hypothetical protein
VKFAWLYCAAEQVNPAWEISEAAMRALARISVAAVCSDTPTLTSPARGEENQNG